MTTSRSPTRVLKAQAKRIARELKAAEQGRSTAPDPSGRLAAARLRDSITFAVCMDDKILKVEMAWATIRATSRKGIAVFILDQMRASRETVH